MANPFANPFSSPEAANNEHSASIATQNTTPNILDLFGMPEPTSSETTATKSEQPSGSTDLLQLSGANPFANVLNTGTTSSIPQNVFGGKYLIFVLPHYVM